MFERVMKYWPIITVSALTIVSVFNIGYFTIIGMHFLGVMDISNVVYAVGLVFSLLIIPIVMFPDGLLSVLQDVANSQDLALKLERSMKWIIGGLALFFVVGLFVHRPFISITGLFAVYFILAYLAFVAYAYIISVSTGSLSPRLIVAGASFGLFTIFWIGGAVAYHEAFGSNKLYTVVTKDAVYENIRLARSSSNGFLITRDKRIMYIPSGEVKSISEIDPVDDNKP
jgi:hypothetical protein